MNTETKTAITNAKALKTAMRFVQDKIGDIENDECNRLSLIKENKELKNEIEELKNKLSARTEAGRAPLVFFSKDCYIDNVLYKFDALKSCITFEKLERGDVTYYADVISYCLDLVEDCQALQVIA